MVHGTHRAEGDAHSTRSPPPSSQGPSITSIPSTQSIGRSLPHSQSFQHYEGVASTGLPRSTVGEYTILFRINKGHHDGFPESCISGNVIIPGQKMYDICIFTVGSELLYFFHPSSFLMRPSPRGPVRVLRRNADWAAGGAGVRGGRTSRPDPGGSAGPPHAAHLLGEEGRRGMSPTACVCCRFTGTGLVTPSPIVFLFPPPRLFWAAGASGLFCCTTHPREGFCPAADWEPAPALFRLFDNHVFTEAQWGGG